MFQLIVKDSYHELEEAVVDLLMAREALIKVDEDYLLNPDHSWTTEEVIILMSNETPD